MLQGAWLALREAMSAPTLPRVPEPLAEMADPTSVRDFHEAGGTDGPLLPVYHFNARAVHALAPRGATVLDLGCGSGRFLAYLAGRRPDLQLIGLDLSAPMVTLGNDMLRAEGISDRVELLLGDMTAFTSALPVKPHVISSIFSLHHLPTRAHLNACARELGAAHRQTSAAIWIFDHARPRREETASRFPEIFTPSAPPAFKLDSRNSLRASWSFHEMREALRTFIDPTAKSLLARFLPLYQVHWLSCRERVADEALWVAGNELTRSAKKDCVALARMFSRAPGW